MKLYNKINYKYQKPQTFLKMTVAYNKMTKIKIILI